MSRMATGMVVGLVCGLVSYAMIVGSQHDQAPFDYAFTGLGHALIFVLVGAAVGAILDVTAPRKGGD